MLRLRRRSTSLGAPPGFLVAGETTEKKAKINLISYSPDDYQEKEAGTVEECYGQVRENQVTWVNIDGTQDVELLNSIGENFSIHPLALEDVVHAGQRPKVEDFGEYLFITIRLPRKAETSSSVDAEQISIFLGQNFVMTIHDAGFDIFEPVIRRMRENKGRIRKMGADYLLYVLIDLVVDQFFPVMESIGDQIEDIEEEIQENPSANVVKKIRKIKHDLILVRSSVWPMREVINGLQREDSDLVTDSTNVFMRDVYDHTIQIADIVESYRDVLSEMFNVYLSVTANSTNDVMKILTIFASIFIPLTFIAGIYGMNFDFMPELHWKPAYFVMLGIMAAVTLAMLRFFRKRGWF